MGSVWDGSLSRSNGVGRIRKEQRVPCNIPLEFSLTFLSFFLRLHCRMCQVLFSSLHFTRGGFLSCPDVSGWYGFFWRWRFYNPCWTFCIFLLGTCYTDFVIRFGGLFYSSRRWVHGRRYEMNGYGWMDGVCVVRTL